LARRGGWSEKRQDTAHQNSSKSTPPEL